MPVTRIARLRPADLHQLETLLRAHHLPTEDCAQQPQIFYGIYDGEQLVAAGGLEPAGEYALLRSVVVSQDYRARGLGRSITEYLLQRAESEGRAAIYLLTESAEDYFAARGFERVAREQVPEAVRRTRQFASLCPDSASCMRMTLPRRGSFRDTDP